MCSTDEEDIAQHSYIPIEIFRKSFISGSDGEQLHPKPCDNTLSAAHKDSIASQQNAEIQTQRILILTNHLNGNAHR